MKKAKMLVIIKNVSVELAEKIQKVIREHNAAIVSMDTIRDKDEKGN